MLETEALLDRWVARLRREEPRAVAILCHGSYARGQAEPHSDLDLDVLIDDEADASYRSAFEELPDGRLLHATIETLALEEWLEQFAEHGESEEWAFFLPARQVARLLWAEPAARERLEGRITLMLELSPQLQDMLESAAKVRNAAARGDELGLRLAAQDMAQRCPALLAPLNPPFVVETRRAALQAALDLAVAPPNYREDMLLCLGLSGRAASGDDVHAAALRLARGVVAALRAAPAALDDLVEPGLPAALADGRLDRLLTQP